MIEKDFDKAIQKTISIIDGFPKSWSGYPYLRLKDGRKLFFEIFIKKYGIKSEKTKYNPKDILRRIRLSEFFMYITQNFETKEWTNNTILIESNFYRMVIKHYGKMWKQRLELLSFYNYL